MKPIIVMVVIVEKFFSEGLFYLLLAELVAASV